MMSMHELLSTLELGLIYGILSMGVYFTFRIINFSDLTADGSFVTGAALSAVCLKMGLNPYLALAASVLFGALAGLMTAVIYRMGVSQLLAGIISAFMLYTVNLRLMGGVPNISLFDSETLFTQVNSLAILVLITFLLILVLGFMLYSQWGLALRVTGFVPNMSKRFGVNTERMVLLTLILSNGIIGLAGGLFSQLQNFADISMGMGTVVVALAAVMMGEKLIPLNNLFAVLFSCVAGSIIYRLLIAFALRSSFLGLKAYDLNFITGILVVAIMVKKKWGKNVKA